MRIAIIGAGVFGSWTAHHLLQEGHEVILIDAFGPAHGNASSGGESRLTRGAYGKDAIYTRMALDSLPEWQALSAQAGLPIFHPCGVLFFFSSKEPYLCDTLEAHEAAGLASEFLDQSQMASRFPMFDFSGIEAGVFEPDFGALMARRAVQTLVERFVRNGGTYIKGLVEPPASNAARLDRICLSSGEIVKADHFIFAIGPWLPKLFPDAVGPRIRVTRQEVFYFAPPTGNHGFEAPTMPCWADFNHGDMFYGFPDLEGRGVKFAHDLHGAEVDPDLQDRHESKAALATVIAFRDRRFPGLRGAPLKSAEVCQYENSSNGDFLIDHHPSWGNVLLVGGGSGHGFKHGPEVGRYAAARTLNSGGLEPRFSLKTKAQTHHREVH